MNGAISGASSTFREDPVSAHKESAGVPKRPFPGIDLIRAQGNTAEAWALSSESSDAREVFAAIASAEKTDYNGLRGRLSADHLEGLDLHWVARLGRIVALQAQSIAEEEEALDLLLASVPTLPQRGGTQRLRRLLFELLYSRGRYTEAAEYLEGDSFLHAYYHGYLRADLINPYRVGTKKSFDEWLYLFNGPFRAHNLAPVRVRQGAKVPFEAMYTDLKPRDEEGPLVSVIVTTYNPDPGELKNAVRSIVEQTWSNLEIIVIDDCSTEIEAGLLRDIEGMDERVRVVQLAVNGGTYRARNIGLRVATGEYITGQDTDDWSHPERIAAEVRVLIANPGLPGVMTTANRTDGELVRNRKGSLPERRCEVSLMFSRQKAIELGGYLAVRKAGDSEFRARLEADAGREVATIPAPLYLIRLSDGSLSRTDFRGGWSHPVRRGFRNLYESWHRAASRLESQDKWAVPDNMLPFKPPRRIQGGEDEPREYDLVFVADWRDTAVSLEPLFAEIRVASSAGFRVGVLQLESPFVAAGSKRELNECLNDLLLGSAELVYLDEAINVNAVHVRNVSVVDYAKHEQSSWRVGKVILAPMNLPTDANGKLAYDQKQIQSVAKHIFSAPPAWALSPLMRRDSFSDLADEDIMNIAYPFVVEPEMFHGTRKRLSPSYPVVGRAANNSVRDWPATRRRLRAAYPVDGSVDVRTLGDARGAVRAFGEKMVPPTWLSFRDREVSSRVFWRMADFCVQFDQHEFDYIQIREMLHAMAAGCVVIADRKYSPYFGTSAVASSASSVPSALGALVNNELAYRDQVTESRAFVEEVAGPNAYIEFLRRVAPVARNTKGIAS